MHPLSDKHQIALTQALSWIDANYDALGIIVSGSIVRGNADENSDFDIYLVHEKPFRQRVQKLFNGVPCEIFINNLSHINTYFEDELKKNRPVTANMLATGKIYKGGNNQHIIDLINTAKNYAVKTPELPESRIQLMKYMFANQLEDATDILSADETTCQYLLDKLVIEIIEYLFLFHRKSLPRIKERLENLIAIDSHHGEMVLNYYHSNDLQGKYETARKLVTGLTGQPGFFEWQSSQD